MEIKATNQGKTLVVSGSLPHRRMSLPYIMKYRKQAADVLTEAGIELPIERDVYLVIRASAYGEAVGAGRPDLDNIIGGVCQVLDGGTLVEPKILADDRQIISIFARYDI